MPFISKNFAWLRQTLIRSYFNKKNNKSRWIFNLVCRKEVNSELVRALAFYNSIFSFIG